MALWRKTLLSSCCSCGRQTKYSCITCGQSVCVRSECSIAEENEETIGWQANKCVGYCLKCGAGGEKQINDCQGEVDNEDIGQRDLGQTSYEEHESDSAEESEEGSSEKRKNKKKRGRRASWKEDQITDMVNIIVNDDQLVNKLIFTNTKKASNTDAYEKVRQQLNLKYNKTTGNDFPFSVAQMRNKFKICIGACKSICMTIKTASGINRFIEEKGYGKWFELLYPLVKTRDSCQPENAVEPSAHGGNVKNKGADDSDDDDDDRASTSSVLTEKSGEVPFKSKSLPVKKPALKRGKTDQVAKALELLQATIDNDPTKELLQILREDMKHSREQEMRYFQMMCGLMTSNGNPNILVNGNPHPYNRPTVQPLNQKGTPSYEAQCQCSDDFYHQGHSLAQHSASNSACNPYAGSSRPRTPSLGCMVPMSSASTAPSNSVEQSLLSQVQSTMASQEQSGISQLYPF